MEILPRRSKRYSASTSTPQLTVYSSPVSNLRRSTRIGRTPAKSSSLTSNATPSTLPTSHKRKRTTSTSTERSPSRSSKRSHLTSNDTQAVDVHPLEALPLIPSQRSQRHRRRHPSVFDDQDNSEPNNSQDIASTSYLPSEGGSLQRRSRKKENPVEETSSFGSKAKSFAKLSVSPARASSLKGKERAHDISFPRATSQITAAVERITRSRTRSQTTPVLFSNKLPTMSQSVVDGASLQPKASKAKAPSKKRKRVSVNEDKSSKRPKVDEKGSQRPHGDPADDVSLAGLATPIPYPTSLPKPIPTLIVTPPTPPSSPPHSPFPAVTSNLPVEFCDQQPTNDGSQCAVWDRTAGSSSDRPIPEDTETTDLAPDASFLSQIQGQSLTPAPRIKPVKRRRRAVAEKPSETLFKVVCRERVDYLKLYYLGQVQEYEADQAYQFFSRISAPPAPTGLGSSSNQQTSSPLRPGSPTWHFASHWQDRLHDAGEWDGRVYEMHPFLPTASSTHSFTSGSEWTDQSWPDAADGEPDFKNEDFFPFELDESDEEEEHGEQPSSLSPVPGPISDGPGIDDEEPEDTESDESEESEDLLQAPPVQGEGQLQLTLPAYTPTPSSLAEALTPLSLSEPPQDSAMGVFALPASPLKKTEPEDATLPTTQLPTLEERQPPSLSFPLPSLSSVIPEDSKLIDADQLSATFQQEILPERAVSEVKALFQSQPPPTFSSTSSSVLLAEIRRQADARLRSPFTRLLDYSSKILGSIGKGTPMDPKRRMNVIAWLEEQKIVKLRSDVRATELLPPLGSAAWYMTRFPSLAASSSHAFHELTPQSMLSSATSPEALLSRANLSPTGCEQAALNSSSWPPLTVHPGELEAMRNQTWMETKTYFGEGVVPAQNVVYQEGSTSTTHHIQYGYSQVNDQDATPNPNSFTSTFNPGIAMDESLSDEDAEGDIDPDVSHPVPLSRFNPSSPNASTSSGSLTSSESQRGTITAVAHGSESYESSRMNSFPSSDQIIASGSSVDGNRGGVYASSSGFSAADIGVGIPHVETPIPVPGRIFSPDENSPPQNFSSHSMSLNVGVSVGFGMVGMDMMGVGFGMGMGIGFPTLETDWLLPGSSSSSSTSLPLTNGEERHSPGELGTSFDRPRERFASPGSPESAFPLGFAMG